MHGSCTAREDDPRRFHSCGRSGGNALFGDSCGRSRMGKKMHSGCTARVDDPWRFHSFGRSGGNVRLDDSFRRSRRESLWEQVDGQRPACGVHGIAGALPFKLCGHVLQQ